jgi:hypothetical protein
MELKQTHPKKKRFIKANIELKPSSIHHYGVFATKDFAPHEIIEECPVIVFAPPITNTREMISNKEFYWDSQRHALALGYGSLYNHADQPNATFINDYINQILCITAAKPIASGTEILINYGKNWFPSRGMKAISQEDLDKKNNFGILKVFALLLILLVLSQIFPIN